MFFGRAGVQGSRPASHFPPPSKGARSQPYAKEYGKPIDPALLGKTNMSLPKTLMIDPTRLFEGMGPGLAPVLDPVVTENRAKARLLLNTALGASSANSTLKGYNNILQAVEIIAKRDLRFALLPFSNAENGSLLLCHLAGMKDWTLQPSDFPTPTLLDAESDTWDQPVAKLANGAVIPFVGPFVVTQVSRRTVRKDGR